MFFGVELHTCTCTASNKRNFKTEVIMNQKAMHEEDVEIDKHYQYSVDNELSIRLSLRFQDNP